MFVKPPTTPPLTLLSSQPLPDASSWCSAEISTCGTLCGGDNGANDCDPDTLGYNCTCGSNSSAPGLQYYQQSMPTFICQQIYENCIVAGQNNAAAQRLCTQAQERNCGKLDVTTFVAPAESSSSSSAAATATSSSASSAVASATNSAAAATSTAAAASYQAPVGVVAAGIAAAFGLLL
ncbi:pci domain-containing protein [Phlyctema vagabunda]|uniref:Pci domain-containing protein n=1 Tax=Phlyctema vagabunda TaxID=108571 RepID=A0ABR4PXN9_9HELO